jgi:hypothetical protein
MIIRGRKKFYCKDCRFCNERGLNVCFFGEHGVRTDICSRFRLDDKLLAKLTGKEVKR